MSEPQLLWTPSESFVGNSNLMHFSKWLKEVKGLPFKSYDELWNWSVDQPADFWKIVSEYFNLLTEGSYKEVMSGTMPEVKWFEGLSLNYAEHVFRNYQDKTPAILFQSETSPLKETSWYELKQQVSSFQ